MTKTALAGVLVAASILAAAPAKADCITLNGPDPIMVCNQDDPRIPPPPGDAPVEDPPYLT